MFLRIPTLFSLSLVGIGSVSLPLPVQAQIAAKSPFLPPQAAATNTPTAGAPLEFRGYIETSQGIQYRLYDPAKKTGTWIKLNEKNPDLDVVVKQHDDQQKTLTIEHQGKTLTLAERESKVVSSGSAAAAIPPPVAAPPAPTNVSPAVTNSVVLNPSPADEQRRLDAVAAEVARRRALREQATQQINQGTTPQIAVPLPAAQPPVQQTPQSAYPQQNLPQNAQQLNQRRGPPQPVPQQR